MKKTSLFLGLAIIALGFAACSNSNQKKAEKSVDNYVVFVDSIEKVAVADARTNWSEIEVAYQLRIAEAETNLANLKEKEAEQAKIDAAKAKYEAYKAQVEAKAEISSKQLLRNALFGEGKIGDDMNFDWVNKDNILGVYQQFVDAAESNKGKYTREDWDEVKVLWEGLDSRKNTVEKEGLTSGDNGKISGLKLKFGPMLKMKRMGAKGEEMKEAKENK